MPRHPDTLVAVDLSPRRVRQIGRRKKKKKQNRQKHPTEKRRKLTKQMNGETTGERKEVMAASSQESTIGKLLKQFNRKRAKKPSPKKLCMYNNPINSPK